MINETGCAAVAVGRGAKGNPWIFREIKAALNGETVPARPTMTEIREMIKRQTALMLEHKPDFITVREMRKHVSWYTAGIRGCSALRDEVNHTETIEELYELLDKRMIDK